MWTPDTKPYARRSITLGIMNINNRDARFFGYEPKDAKDAAQELKESAAELKEKLGAAQREEEKEEKDSSHE